MTSSTPETLRNLQLRPTIASPQSDALTVPEALLNSIGVLAIRIPFSTTTPRNPTPSNNPLAPPAPGAPGIPRPPQVPLVFPPDLRPPPEPLGFSARPSPTPGALGVPRPNGGRPLGRSGFSARPRAPGVPHPTSARAIFGFPPDHRPPRCPCLPPPTPPAPGCPRAPPPAPRPRAHPCPTARPTRPGHLGFPASPAPSLASPPARTGAAPSAFRCSQPAHGAPGVPHPTSVRAPSFPRPTPARPGARGVPPDSARPRDPWDSRPSLRPLGFPARPPPPGPSAFPARPPPAPGAPGGSPPPYGAP